MPITWTDQNERNQRNPRWRYARVDLTRNVCGRVAQSRFKRALSQVNWWAVFMLAVGLLSTAIVIALAAKAIGLIV